MNEDVLWGHAFGSWADMKAVMGRVRKWRKEGFYLEVDQLDGYDYQQLKDALRNHESVGNIKEPWKHLVRDEFDIFKTPEVFHAKLYGPGPIIHRQHAKEPEPLDHYVLQQEGPNAYPAISCAMTRTEALRHVDQPANNVITTVLKVVKRVDRWVDPKELRIREIKRAAAAVAENPSPENMDALRCALALEQHAD
jgi:hypothetical protein